MIFWRKSTLRLSLLIACIIAVSIVGSGFVFRNGDYAEKIDVEISWVDAPQPLAEIEQSELPGDIRATLKITLVNRGSKTVFRGKIAVIWSKRGIKREFSLPVLPANQQNPVILEITADWAHYEITDGITFEWEFIEAK
jgi:hypothetical protein